MASTTVPPIHCADGPVVVAVSGGCDSMVMLHLVAQGASSRADVHVVHVQHGLRGADSDADQQLVQDVCQELGVSCHVVACPIDPTSSGIEAAAREARYAAFATVAMSVGAAIVMTAHTADDQAETMLLHLGRGTGMAGMRGIPERRQLCPGVTVWRPLLHMPRSAVRATAHAYNVAWREDASNTDRRFLRNRIRHELMPVMQRMFGDTVSQRMARTARVIDDARAVVDGVLDEVVAKCVTTVSNGLHIDVDAFRDLSPGLQRELVRSVLQPVHDGLPADASTIERVRALVDAEVGSETPIGPSYRACREHNHIVVSPRHVPQHVRFAITDSGAYVAATGVLHVSVGDVNTVSIDYHPTIAFMDADAIQGPLVWRTWEDGDRFQPLGFHGSMLVSDVLANAKAPHLYRREATVLCDNEGIVWVCGYRLANRVRIQPSTRSLLVARIHAPSLNLLPPPESDHD